MMENESYRAARDAARQVYKEAYDTIYQLSYQAAYNAYVAALATTRPIHLPSDAKRIAFDSTDEGVRDAYHEGGYRISHDAINKGMADAIRAHEGA